MLDNIYTHQTNGPRLETFTSQVIFNRADTSPRTHGGGGSRPALPAAGCALPSSAGCQPSPRPQSPAFRAAAVPGSAAHPAPPTPACPATPAAAPQGRGPGRQWARRTPRLRPGRGRRCEAGPGGRPASLLGDAGMFTGPAGAAGGGEEVGAAAGARAARQEPR